MRSAVSSPVVGRAIRFPSSSKQSSSSSVSIRAVRDEDELWSKSTKSMLPRLERPFGGKCPLIALTPGCGVYRSAAATAF
jgi:hypothetical protein